MEKKYLFKSERLGFREWTQEDVPEFSKLNSDLEVMKYFPKTLVLSETIFFMERLQAHFSKNGFCYFATDELATNEFIGFIGLASQNFKSPFTPAIDIGWRLKKESWGKGYATEGAKKCLEYAFNELKIDKVIATCTLQNKKSENVMKKIGMKKLSAFKHPKLSSHPEHENCVCYQIKASRWQVL
jgi:RimJ/RimL family protein N-acetyltransferase